MSSPRARPRLLLTPPLSGAANMALDEVALRAATTAGPVVRVTAWSPPAVSLGYAQPVAGVDCEACRRHGIDVTRRLTGGRAVLHHQELTYTVCVPAELVGPPRSISRAYGILSGCLGAALEAAFGLVAVCSPRTGAHSAPQDPACFGAALGGDLSVGGRKLVGSAQCHKFGGILQHGSIPVRVDEALLAACLRRPVGAARDWTCLAELGVPELDLGAFQRTLAYAFAELFGAVPEPCEPSDEEWAEVERLTTEKYAAEAWIARL